LLPIQVIGATGRLSNNAIAKRLSTSHPTALLRRDRFEEQGPKGLTIGQIPRAVASRTGRGKDQNHCGSEGSHNLWTHDENLTLFIYIVLLEQILEKVNRYKAVMVTLH
jgi:DNA-binding Lrp family transcriptional regulator